jgi:diguanylate cyclase (GGDEF)-like protein
MPNRLNFKSVEEHYAAMAKYLAVTAAVFFPIFAVNNFVQDRDLIGYVSVAVILILALNAVLLRRVGYNPLRTFFFVVPALLTFIALVFIQQGVISALWCTPALFAFYFILPERYAWLANGFLIVIATLFAELTLEHNLALRISVTLTIAAILGGIFVRIISSQQALLKEQAVSDPLSGLKNRMLLYETLEQAIKLNQRNKSVVTLLELDIDHFKKINDQYGHGVGDQVIVSVADILKARVRKSDTAFRIGGEEFLCLLHHCDRDQGEKIAEQIRCEIMEAGLLPDHHQSVTVSLGVAGYQPGETTESWLKRVDDNLYRAKSAGRNRVFSSPVESPNLQIPTVESI